MAEGRGAIIRGRRLFLIFRSKGGDYSREAINRGTAIIRGNTVFYFVMTFLEDILFPKFI